MDALADFISTRLIKEVAIQERAAEFVCYIESYPKVHAVLDQLFRVILQKSTRDIGLDPYIIDLVESFFELDDEAVVTAVVIHLSTRLIAELEKEGGHHFLVELLSLHQHEGDYLARLCLGDKYKAIPGISDQFYELGSWLKGIGEEDPGLRSAATNYLAVPGHIPAIACANELLRLEKILHVVDMDALAKLCALESSWDNFTTTVVCGSDEEALFRAQITGMFIEGSALEDVLSALLDEIPRLLLNSGCADFVRELIPVLLSREKPVLSLAAQRLFYGLLLGDSAEDTEKKHNIMAVDPAFVAQFFEENNKKVEAHIGLVSQSRQSVTVSDIRKHPLRSGAKMPLPENGILTVPDLHANALLMLQYLIRAGVVKMSDDAYWRFEQNYHKIARKPISLQRKGLYGFEDIIEGNDLSAEEEAVCVETLMHIIAEDIDVKGDVRWVNYLGDIVADRGANDLLILALLRKIKITDVDYQIIFSNHDLNFIVAALSQFDLMFWESVPGLLCIYRPSSLSLIRLLRALPEAKSDALRQELLTLYKEVYLPHLIVFDGFFEEEGEAGTLYIFSHAKADPALVRAVALQLGIYCPEVITVDAFLQVIININAVFRHMLETSEKPSDLFKFVFGMVGCAGVMPDHSTPLCDAIWRRSAYSKIDCTVTFNDKPVVVNINHGHDGKQVISCQSNYDHSEFGKCYGERTYSKGDIHFGAHQFSGPGCRPSEALIKCDEIAALVKVARRFSENDYVIIVNMIKSALAKVHSVDEALFDRAMMIVISSMQPAEKASLRARLDRDMLFTNDSSILDEAARGELYKKIGCAASPSLHQGGLFDHSAVAAIGQGSVESGHKPAAAAAPGRPAF